jgi:hypothetical protein
LEGDAGHALHFIARVDHGVEGYALFLVPAARLAIVEAAEQFADKHNVGPVDDLGPQRAVDRQLLEGEDGAQVGEAAQGRAQSEQTGLGTLAWEEEN